jgi:UDP-2,4-diacetamido-2,4,6-trideoxy-beta-L-altropyranose hydrolase
LKFVFRVDSSSQIGTGHVIRCLTLADALSAEGSICLFICRAHTGNLIDLIAERGYEVRILPFKNDAAEHSYSSDLGHSSWLGTDWLTDATQTIKFLQSEQIDWIIVDHYALDWRWEIELRKYAEGIMVIDDLTDRRHTCDLLLNQNYGSSESKYQGLVPHICEQLHGPSFALLNPVYAKNRMILAQRTGNVNRVLIYFGGGADSKDLTGMTLKAFESENLSRIHIDIVVGSAYCHNDSLSKIAERRGRVNIHTRLPHLADLMSQADFAVGAGGATTWERCCLGLPSLVISVADNQLHTCEILHQNEVIIYSGPSEETSVNQINNQISAVINQPQLLQQLSRNSMSIVDGLGGKRVVEVLNKN